MATWWLSVERRRNSIRERQLGLGWWAGEGEKAGTPLRACDDDRWMIPFEARAPDGRRAVCDDQQRGTFAPSLDPIEMPTDGHVVEVVGEHDNHRAALCGSGEFAEDGTRGGHGSPLTKLRHELVEHAQVTADKCHPHAVQWSRHLGHGGKDTPRR